MLELRWKRLSCAGYVNEFKSNTNNVAWATNQTKEITVWMLCHNMATAFLAELSLTLICLREHLNIF